MSQRRQPVAFAIRVATPDSIAAAGDRRASMDPQMLFKTLLRRLIGGARCRRANAQFANFARIAFDHFEIKTVGRNEHFTALRHPARK